jgi:ribonuclease D
VADYALITTPAELDELVQKLSRERVIAVDTEADSFYHYFDKLCLVQIGYRGGIALVDPLVLPEDGLEPLRPILANPEIRKIFHAADYDLYVLSRYGDFRVRNIFDTMISAQLLGYPAVGLAALAERHFGVHMSKDQQRTDWSRRELKTVQLEYAAGDVRYLAELAQKLERELRAKKRLNWAESEFRALEERVWPEREFDKYGFMRIKGSRQLPPRGLAVLRELFLMRDARAREMDRPPFKVLGNGTLLDLAKNPPRSRRALAECKGVTELVVRRMGKELIEAIKQGLQGPEVPPPEPKRGGNGRRRLDRRAEVRLERLKKWRARRAEELELDPGVFCPNITLEEIAWGNPADAEACAKLKHVKPWWAESFAVEVVAALQPAEQPETEAGAEAGGGGAKRDGDAQPERPAGRRRGGRGRKRRSGKRESPRDGLEVPWEKAPWRTRSQSSQRSRRSGSSSLTPPSSGKRTSPAEPPTSGCSPKATGTWSASGRARPRSTSTGSSPGRRC